MIDVKMYHPFLSSSKDLLFSCGQYDQQIVSRSQQLQGQSQLQAAIQAFLLLMTTMEGSKVPFQPGSGPSHAEDLLQTSCWLAEALSAHVRVRLLSLPNPACPTFLSQTFFPNTHLKPQTSQHLFSENPNGNRWSSLCSLLPTSSIISWPAHIFQVSLD